jgi:deoxyribodipyrimidine photo-lyase
VPELDHLAGNAVHEPWKSAVGYERGYPLRIVDHADERREALERYRAARA